MTTATTALEHGQLIESRAEELPPMTEWEAARAEEIYSQQLGEIQKATDRRFLWLMVVQWIGGIIIAASVSPRAWSGSVSTAHIHLIAAIALGGAIVSLPILFAWLQPGKVWTRHIIAVGQMLYGALLIHLTGGRIETHFHVFGSLAFLAFYRDWRVLLTATVIVVIDHGWRAFFWPSSVFGVDSGSIFRVLEHGGWVIFEDFFLWLSIGLALRETKRLAIDQARVESLNLAIAASKQESDTIMATVNQGLFLIDRDFEIGTNYSNALRSILGMDDLARKNFLSILRNTVSEKVYHNSRDFLELMFNPGKREKQVAKLNPLNEVEVSFANEAGGLETRHLEYRFNRVYAGREIPYLLVAVSDATERFQLQRQLEFTEQKRERQLEMLLGILHVDPALLSEFISSTERTLSEVNAMLRGGFFAESGSINADMIAPKLDDLFRAIHGVKGNAAALQIRYFENQAHAIEEKLQNLKRANQIVGEDFLPVVMLQAELRADLDEIQGLIDRLASLKKQPQKTAETPEPFTPERAKLPQPLFDQIELFVQKTSAKLGKQTDLVWEDIEESSIPAQHREVFRDVVVQMARNALAHGIEPPSARDQLHKMPRGLIQVRGGAENGQNGHFEFFVRDDGQGLQIGKLKQRAVAMGIASDEELQSWNPGDLATLIFEPGFSTAEQVTAEAGRGYGMDVVKARVVDDFGGEIRISSVPGQFCEFQVILPLEKASAGPSLQEAGESAPLLAANAFPA